MGLFLALVYSAWELFHKVPITSFWPAMTTYLLWFYVACAAIVLIINIVEFILMATGTTIALGKYGTAIARFIGVGGIELAGLAGAAGIAVALLMILNWLGKYAALIGGTILLNIALFHGETWNWWFIGFGVVLLLIGQTKSKSSSSSSSSISSRRRN